MPPKKAPAEKEPPEAKVNFYPAWCKRCGNCVAFCPRQALAADQWGHPHLADPERCTSCGLCEMLCPDFAISVGPGKRRPKSAGQKPRTPRDRMTPHLGPERLAQVDEEGKRG